MNQMTNTVFTLESASQVLLRCFWIGLGFVLFTYIWFLVAGDVAYKAQSQWFDLTKHQVDLIVYSVLGIEKLIIFFGFLAPYLAIRLVLGRRIPKPS
jgi:hypothetical protein